MLIEKRGLGIMSNTTSPTEEALGWGGPPARIYIHTYMGCGGVGRKENGIRLSDVNAKGTYKKCSCFQVRDGSSPTSSSSVVFAPNGATNHRIAMFTTNSTNH